MCWLLSSNGIRVILIHCPNVYIQSVHKHISERLNFTVAKMIIFSLLIYLIRCQMIKVQNFRNGVLTVRSLDFGLLFDWLFTDRQTHIKLNLQKYYIDGNHLCGKSKI
ncbi:hypothetical protein T08_2513 [Trichinella sp. T8]|nr:hypothetical protein T08_2513 [Trichinella sp. T8]